ncbi:MAG: adenylyl-sulfate kinase [Acidimicrobiales bacterium]|jgi:bifunctional enzyme CysN/CysC
MEPTPDTTAPHGTGSPDGGPARAPDGGTIWLTGLSGAGKSTLAVACRRLLVAAGRPVVVLDGDALRQGLSADLSFSPVDRAEHVRRVGEVARLVAAGGVVALAPVISPYRADRDRVRALHARSGLRFVEVHVATPLAVCEARDGKGLYRQARLGLLPDLTGVGAPYEAPPRPEVRVDTTEVGVDELARRIVHVFTG